VITVVGSFRRRKAGDRVIVGVSNSRVQMEMAGLTEPRRHTYHPLILKGQSVRIDRVTPNRLFWQILASARPNHPDFSASKFLALDPGETTGVAWWDGTTISLWQWDTKDLVHAFQTLEEFLHGTVVDHIRIENYRVYGWMADSHSWSELHTAQWIGGIKICAGLNNVPLSLKMAQAAKAFWTDEKLKSCQIYSAGLKHARDACRHLLYYMTFPDKRDD
jgi:hypothetical protein